jgi:hypothetical protein
MKRKRYVNSLVKICWNICTKNALNVGVYFWNVCNLIFYTSICTNTIQYYLKLRSLIVKNCQEHSRLRLFRLKSCLPHFSLVALDWNFGAGASYWSDHQSLPPRRPIGQITNKCRQKRSTLYVQYKSCHRHTRAGRGEGGGGSSPRSRYLLWIRWIQLSLRHLNHNLNNSAWISTFLSFLRACPLTSTVH